MTTQPTQEDFDNLNLSIEAEEKPTEPYKVDKETYTEFVDNVRSLSLILKEILVVHDGKSKKVQAEMKLVNGELVERRLDNKLDLYQEEILRQLHYCLSKGYINLSKDE